MFTITITGKISKIKASKNEKWIIATLTRARTKKDGETVFTDIPILFPSKDKTASRFTNQTVISSTVNLQATEDKSILAFANDTKVFNPETLTEA